MGDRRFRDRIAFQSTPPVKAATMRGLSKLRDLYISIHAAREGGDNDAEAYKAAIDISIHAAREGGDSTSTSVNLPSSVFQSTPPVKAATAETNRRNQHFRKQQV